MFKINLDKKRLVIAGIILFLILSVSPSIYFYRQYQRLQQTLKDPSLANKAEVKALVERVGKLIKLPEGEEPTIATVTDLEKLKNQPFFAKAKISPFSIVSILWS